MTNKPESKVSVILPVRNGLPYVRDAVNSILRQTFRTLELIVVDNGSTDGTSTYLRSVEDRRLRVLRWEPPGLVGALNYGLSEAMAPVVARMDADDVAIDARIAKQWELLNANPKLVLLSCQFDLIDANGQVTGHANNLKTDEAIRWRMLFTPAFVHPGAMFDREAALRVGGYNAGFRVAQDFDLWTRLAKCGRMGNHPESLLQYRVLKSGLSESNRDLQIKNSATIAARYAASLTANIGEDQWYEFHRFSSEGKVPSAYSLLQLSRSFATARNLFRSRYGKGCSELNDSISAFEQHLRWRCSDFIKMTHGLRKLDVYRAALQFDPKGTRLSSVVRRRLLRWAGRQSLHRESVTFGPSASL